MLKKEQQRKRKAERDAERAKKLQDKDSKERQGSELIKGSYILESDEVHKDFSDKEGNFGVIVRRHSSSRDIDNSNLSH